MKSIDRRNFIKKSSLSAASVYAVGQFKLGEAAQERSIDAKYMGDFAAPKIENVRIGIIGVGSRGSGHILSLIHI